MLATSIGFGLCRTPIRLVFGALLQLIDPVGHALRCGFAKLLDRPVGGVALSQVGGPGMVDQPFRQGTGNRESLGLSRLALATPLNPKLG